MALFSFALSACIGGHPSLHAYSVKLPPRISISVPDEVAVEGREIPLSITVDCMAQDRVNTASFQIDGRGLEVEVVQETTVAPEELYREGDAEALTVNRYRAILPKKPAGVYSVGPVTAEVGSGRYSSNIITVHVQPAVTSDAFRLEAAILSPPKIFPGQEVTFEYRIFFQGSMQLLREELPMLRVSGFLTASSPEITTEPSGGGYVQVIRQRARAVTPGTYESGVSIVEGMGMVVSGGIARPAPPLYRAIAPSVPVTILPFPEANKPPFFDGALGCFVWRVMVPGGVKVPRGQGVEVEYRVSGRGELATVSFPPLESLSGLSDVFWTEGSSPVGKEKEGTKTFSLVVRPKRGGAIEIPGFFVASFDPYSEQYLTVAVPPVKLTVEGEKEMDVELAKASSETGSVLSPPFEIDAATATARHLSPLWIPVAAAAAVLIGVLQFIVKRQMGQQKEKKITSRDLFYKAVMNRSKREKGLQLLRQAFYMQLFEKGLTMTLVDAPEAIAGEGLVAEVRALLELIDRQLYNGKDHQSMPLQDIYDEASALYYRVKHLQVKQERGTR